MGELAVSGYVSVIVMPSNVAGPPAEVVACAGCASQLPDPWLIVRDPPSASSSLDNGTAKSALWDFNDLLVSAPALRECPRPRLVIAVRTEAHRRAQRNVIRRTWGHPGNYANCSLRVVFIMGAENVRRVTKVVKAEFQLYRDMVVELTPSRWWQPTCTLVLAIEWVPYYYLDASLAVVIRDDTFVRVKAVISAIDSFSRSTGDFFGRVTFSRRPEYTGPQLEGCAIFVKPRALARLQPAFADEPLTCDLEDALVTGRLARKANLNIVHDVNMEPCDNVVEGADSDARYDGMPDGLLTRSGVSVRGMERLYLWDMGSYHKLTASIP
ncbi:hypothetical protein HPB48_004768 [Haemaphysalis longicornis]|uniref:Hexosyltransferase n=1 Tax=Haemaphysalis longicornis TaxID=44386 RepID=A0A9J6G0H5_HAELO|nr:hypothetical protein HPB48_004768 [Haemaphysalis longicornis]